MKFSRLWTSLLALTVICSQAVELPKEHSGIADTCWTEVLPEHTYDDALLIDILTTTKDKPACYARTGSGFQRGTSVYMSGHVFCGIPIEGEAPQLLKSAVYLVSNYKELEGAIKHNHFFKKRKTVTEQTFVNQAFESCEEVTDVQGQSTAVPIDPSNTLSEQICLSTNDQQKGSEYIYFGVSKQEGGKTVCAEVDEARYYKQPSSNTGHQKATTTDGCMVPKKIGDFVHVKAGWIEDSWGWPLNHKNGVRKNTYQKCVQHYGEMDILERYICTDGKHCVSGYNAKFEGHGFEDDGNECWMYDPDKAATIADDECVR